MSEAQSEASGNKGRSGLVVALFGLVAFAVFAMLCPDALSSGDPAVYHDQMTSQNFDGRTVHLGYFWLGAAYVSIFPATDLSLNLLHALLGALCVTMVGFITAELTGRLSSIAAASLTATVNMMVMDGATHAEVYVPQCFFLLVVVFVLIRPSSNRPALLLGAISLAMAVLITPSSLLVVPALVVLRPKLRDLALVFSVGALLTVLALSGSWYDYLFSQRGLLAAKTGIARLEALQKEIYEVFRGFGALLPFLPAGVAACLERSKKRGALRARFLGAIATLGVVNFFLGERFSDVPVQLPTYLLSMVLVGLAVEWLPELLSRSVSRSGRLSLLLSAAALAVVPPISLMVARSRSRSLASLPDALLPAIVTAVVIAFLVGLVFLVFNKTTLQKAQRTVQAIFLVCALATGTLSIVWVQAQNKVMVDLKTRLVAADQQIDDDAILVSTWTQGILFEHYTQREIYSGVFVDEHSLALEPSQQNEKRMEDVERFKGQLRLAAPVLVLTESTEALDQLREQGYQAHPLEGFSYFTR